jgi:6-pyruvoyltetrahydropterin/6-carboxytetrahydropterin synthase
MEHRSIKTYGHDVGLSCAFRQWRASSHCHCLHGYAMAVTIEFGAVDLDACGWVVDFGGLREIKDWLQVSFDHKTVVATDDPHLEWFREGMQRGVLDLVLVESTGCEAFARLISFRVQAWLIERGLSDRVHIKRVEVREHGANAASIEM